MMPETVAALIEGVAEHFPLASDIEISLEANPTSAEAQSFKGYHEAGINRLSMGIQSLSDDALKFLGREHTVSEALKTIELARGVFPNISFDLIYALPDQSLEEWKKDLKRALTLAGDHISLYQLTIEPNTGFAGALKRKEFSLLKDEQAEEMFEFTQDACADAGLHCYEISNHAREGFECRHNLTYWRYGYYLGIGPGAHGRVETENKRQAFEQIKRPEKWLEQVGRLGHGTLSDFVLTQPEELTEECLLMGLRLREGVWFKNFENAVGQPFSNIISSERLARLKHTGFLESDDYRVRATEKGRFVLNSVLAELIS